MLGGEDADHFVTERKRLAESAGMEQRGGEGDEFGTPFDQKIAAGYQHFFGMAAGDLGGSGRAPAFAHQNGLGVPGLAHAVAVEMAAGEVTRHERWGEKDDLDIGARPHAVLFQPGLEEKVVGGIAVGSGQGEGPTLFPTMGDVGGKPVPPKSSATLKDCL